MSVSENLKETPLSFYVYTPRKVKPSIDSILQYYGNNENLPPVIDKQPLQHRNEVFFFFSHCYVINGKQSIDTLYRPTSPPCTKEFSTINFFASKGVN